MNESEWSQVVKFLNMAVIEYGGEGEFRLLGEAPDWLHRFFPALAQNRDIQFYEMSPFLEYFLEEAEEFWQSDSEEKLRSGTWSETDEFGNECSFEATAVRLNNKKLMIIEVANYSHEEKQHIIQKGRELALAYHKLAQTEAELHKAKLAAEQANEAKSRFLANMSHEIRTPITSIIGVTDMMISMNPPEEYRDNLKIIKDSSMSLLLIVNDILDLSKIEARKLELFHEDFDLYEMMKRTLRTLRIQAQNKGIKLNSLILTDVPRYLIGDAGRLRQIITNLISNAIKFTHTGSVTFYSEKLQQNDQDVTLMFSVKDTGIGIPKNKVADLFQSFNQLDNSYAKQYGGTGLGLAISKKLTEMMGGRIWADSEEGKGSTFYFTATFKLSQEKPADLPQPEQPEPEAETPAVSGSAKILLAEDSPFNQKFMSFFLLKEGYEVVMASNGKEVLEALKKERFDVILMDIQMPEMDGVETTTRIRNYESGIQKLPEDLTGDSHFRIPNAHIPIIALTAYTMKGDMQRFMEAGMDDYVSKPVNREELFKALKRVLASSRK